MSKRYPTWIIRWNEERTEGIIWRMIDWSGYTPAPCIEGRIRILSKVSESSH